MSKTPTVTAKFKTPTCVLCRQRKLRCDGETPCGPCSRARTLVVCTYIPKSVGQLRSELPKGAACISCRQRKRRCDGNLPCRTCKSTSRADECQYREKAASRKANSNSAEQDRLSLLDGGSTCSTRSTNTSSLHVSPPYTPEYFSSFHQPADSVDDIDTLLKYFPLPEFDNSTTDQWFSASGGSPPTNAIGLTSLPSYLGDPTRDYASSPEFPDPAQDRDGELFALRNLFLDHSWHYGLTLTAEKRDALSRGDTSGLSVPPVLVNVCQLLGYLLANHSKFGKWHYFLGQTDGEAAQAQIIRDILQSGDLDPSTEMQVYCIFALYQGMKGDVPAFMELWDKLGTLVLRNLAMFALDDTMPVQYTPQLDSESCCPRGPAQELLSIFSEIIMLETGRTLVWKLPPSFDPSVLARFRQLVATNRMGTELNLMRAKSFLFLFDSQQLVAEYGRHELAHPSSSAWSQRYWNLIEDIQAHLNEINTPLLEVSFIHQAQVLTLRICVTTAFAALADLYALFAPFQPESRRKHGEVIEQIAAIASMFYDKDFPYLDANLGVAWVTALRPISEDVPPAQWDDGSRACAQRLTQALDIIRECHRKLGQAVPYVPQL
ncbi:hypothetical protein FB451DRAFT_1373281 [Mycena latifolia]|nr:hypothetical protein FB451DRAFT_1373281 [Mycena latifolia]